MKSETITYRVHEVSEYINWVYFFHAWGFSPRYASVASVCDCVSCQSNWIFSFPYEERIKAQEAVQLFMEAQKVLKELDEQTSVRTLYRLCPTNAEGDDLLIDGLRFPCLRQQKVKEDGQPYLCLSDFIRPLSSGIPDTIGLFATTVHEPDTEEADAYKRLLIQTLTDRLAEAGAEKLHQYVRKEAWGYAPDEQLNIEQLHKEEFQGIRPAVGYPSLPDQSVNFLLDQLLDMHQIGITLTENGAMNPHASVSGLMFAHPQARYFSVGKIGEDQFQDYVRRRVLPADEMRKFLAACLE